MSTRNLAPVRALVRNTQILAGKFRPNGSSAIDNTLNIGKGFTVARTSAGVYTITFADKYKNLLAIVPGLEMNAAANTYVQVGAVSLVTSTVVITNYTGGGTTPADIAANAGNRINFIAVFSDTATQ